MGKKAKDMKTNENNKENIQVVDKEQETPMVEAKEEKTSKKTKKEKAPKEPKEKKDSKAEKKPKEKVKKAKKSMPEGYIGRPKPMKTKKFEFKKPTASFYVGLVFLLAFLGFATYIVFRLINVSKETDSFVKAYEFDEKKAPETLTLENDDLLMTFDVKTTQFSITKKSTGHVWYSNPLDVDNDKIALTKEKNNMKSILLVKYSTENGVNNTYDSYTYSILRNFFNVNKVGNTISVNYTISQMAREFKFPLAIYESEMDEYLEQLSSSDKNTITKRCYELFDIEDMDYDEYEEMIEKYPGLDEDNLYLIFDPLQTYLKTNLEKIFAKIDYSDEDYIRHKEQYKEKVDKVEPAFNITVNYTLDGDKLVVDVPFDDIVFRRDYPIVQLNVLPYFGASSFEDEGYMFVPEGGGSIINFNNGKTKQNNYYADVYGWDYASDRSAVIKETRTSYPVFGEVFGDNGFICILEEGAEYAGINAEISGKLASYNYVNAQYKMIHGEQFKVSTRNTSAQYSYEDRLPEGESIKQVYQFIDSSSYVDLALSYRDYLFDGSERIDNKTTPLAIEIIGAVDKVQQIAGIPKTLPYKLTSYDETTRILEEIENEGIKNASVKLSGFINGGVKQKLLKKVDYIDALGGKSKFKKMIDNVSQLSSKLYLDTTVQFAHRSDLSDGFNRYSSPARFASDEVCEISQYSPIWYGKLDTVDTYYLLNPDLINRSQNVINEFAKKMKLDGISYRDVGYQLSSDFNEDKVVTRATARAQQVEKLQEANDLGLSLMVNYGNDYVLDNVDFITNMQLHGNSYAIIDKQIPFYQIALHGYKNYAGSAVNLGYEIDQIILEAAETGAGLYFIFMNENESKLQETMYTEYYAACFDNWKNKFYDIYREYDRQISPVKNSLIENHEYLSSDVTVTTFDNDYQVYVNFGYENFATEDGFEIPARSYKVINVVED